MLGRFRGAVSHAARYAASGAAFAAAVPVVATAGLVGESARVGARAMKTAVDTTAAVGELSGYAAKKVVAKGAQAVGSVVAGGDPFPTGKVRTLGDVAKGMVEPPDARHHRRVWAEHGHAQLELAAPAAEGTPEVRRALLRHLERLDGVQWAVVNDVVGRVLVAFDERRVRVEDVVGVVTAVEQARGGTQVFPQHEDHPADLEPLLAAIIDAAVDVAAVGVALTAKYLPIPPVSRHVTLLIALLDTQDWIKDLLTRRIGVIGTDLVFTGTSALLHSATQSPTIPALNAVAAIQQAVEMRARRQVWHRREPELCRPEPEDDVTEPLQPPGPRPAPLPNGPIETYRHRLGPTELGAALGLLPLTRRPGRSADLLKALTPKAAAQGRESFAAALDWLMCREGVLPMDGSAYRRLDRVSAVVVDGDALCTGPPVIVEATAEDDDWDDARVWTAATRLLGADDTGEDDVASNGGPKLRLGPAKDSPEAPGGEQRAVYAGRRRVGSVVVAAELDPHAEALLAAANGAGLRTALTAHVGTREIAQAADETADPDEPLVDTVRRLQSDGHGVLVVSAADGPALLAADVAVAPVREGRAPAWGADLVTGPDLVHACRLVEATEVAKRVSRWSVETAITGNVLGGLLAAVGSARYGQQKATTPGKWATLSTLVGGTWSAVRLAQRPAPPPSVHTPWHALEPDDVCRRLADLPTAEEGDGDEPLAPLRRVARHPVLRVPVRFGRTVAAELSDPLTPVLGTGAAATAMLGQATDAILVGSVTAGNALLSALQRLRAETALESLLMEQDVTVHRETDGGGREDVPSSALRVGDLIQVEAGDVLAADARLLEVNDLEVDESSLTGESLSVGKSVPATPGADVADRTCMLFDGTTVVAGSGRAVVVAVGQSTQAGRAARAAGAAAPPAGVQVRLGELTRSVLPVTLAGGGLVAGLGVLWGRPLREAVAAGLAIAVAAVPEGLPLVATVAQQSAAQRLSKRGAVVRSARVLEALGRVDTVVFDKTGTLTENRLRVQRLVPCDSEMDDDGLLRLAAEAVGIGDEQAHETDRAVVEAATERGAMPEGEPDGCVSFTAGRGFSAGLRDGRLAVKGAPEVVAARCAGTPDLRERVQALAGDGLRVLAVADRALDGEPDDLEEAAQDLTLRGLIALADTVRESSVTAVEQLRAAGVRVIVATGDHPETAAAIAAQAGVPDADRVVTGKELARASDADRVKLVRETAVFARLSPEQKVTLVSALRKNGATLAMTGDGVNDAAAIRLADVGVGVEGAESPAARTAADLVLTDIDLTRLVDAIAEGRAMWSRVRDAVSVLVGGNAGEVAFTVLGTALGGRAPLGTRQLLLVNLLTDMFPALAVAVAAPRRTGGSEDGEGPLAGHPLEEVLVAGPYRGFTEAVRKAVLVRGTATTFGATGAWAIGRVTGLRGRAGTMGLAALISTQLGQTAWAGRRSPLVLGTVAGSLLVLFGVVQTPGISQFFGCTPLDPISWLIVLGWAAAGTAGAELLPAWLDRRRGAPA